MACPINGTQLSFKDFRSFQADADRTVAHRRIFFFAKFKVIYLFICPDIKSTDDYLLSCHHFHDCLIGFELFLFRWVRIFFQIQKFTSEQSDSGGII